MAPPITSKRAERSRRHYEKHRKEILDKRRKRRESGQDAEYKRRYRKSLSEIVIAAKDVPCADCGLSYPPYVMDFDHVRGTKVANIAKMVSMNSSRERLLAEITKCDVVCANCHRLRTHNQ